jgi:hypothetical protein
MSKPVPIGISGGGVLHTDANIPDVDTVFRTVAESGAFDYIERTPPTGQLDAFQRASAAHNIPLRTGGFFYTLGRDEPLLEWHLRIARELGMVAQNVQILWRNADGEPVTNEDVAEAYLWAAELGDKLGVQPCFEVHINMWSERFRRVAEVARLVEARGVDYRMTLDHSHVIFKMDNLREHKYCSLGEDLEDGSVILDPARPGNVCAEWIDSNWVAHAHARPAIPNNPPNIKGVHPNGSVGRGVQYPFLPTTPSEYHAPWDGAKLEPWKMVLRRLFMHHANYPGSPLGQVTVEMIPGIDYGAGCGYSIFEHSVAVAQWLRDVQK